MSKYKFILINDEDGTETDLSREFIPDKSGPDETLSVSSSIKETRQWLAAYWQMEEIVKRTLRVVKEKE